MRTDRYRTKLREALLELFSHHPSESLTARRAYEELAPSFENLSITSVYRNLDRLVEEEILVRATTEDGRGATYLWGEGGSCYNHLHMQCVTCGRVLHLDCGDTEHYIRHLAEEHGFRLLCGKTTLVGLCRACAEGSK